MTHQMQALGAALENKQTELRNAIRSYSSQLIIEDEHDQLDRMQIMYSRDRTVTLLDVLSRTLTDVTAALLAMKEGSYGICVECEEEIGTARLARIPWASLCIRCKESLERRERARQAGPLWDEAA